MRLYTVQSKNFDFLRHRYGTHKSLTQRLEGTVSWNQLSRFATAEATASPNLTERVEAVLSLPIGWFDRDNFAFTQLSAEDHELFSLILDAHPSAKTALLHLLKALQPKTETVVTAQKDQQS